MRPPPISQPEPDPQRVNFYLPFAEDLATFQLEDVLIFTDGSFTPTRSLVDTVFDHQTTTSRSGASVIQCSATGKHPPIAFYLADGHAANLDSVPSTELVALYAAPRSSYDAICTHRSLYTWTPRQTSLDKLLARTSALDPRAAGYAVALAYHRLLRF